MKNMKITPEMRRLQTSGPVLLALTATLVFAAACSEPRTDMHGNLKAAYVPGALTPAPAASASAGSALVAGTQVDGGNGKDTLAPDAGEVRVDLQGGYKLNSASCEKTDSAGVSVGTTMDSFPSKGDVSIEIEKDSFQISIQQNDAENCTITMFGQLNPPTAPVAGATDVTYTFKNDLTKTAITKKKDMAKTNGPATVEACPMFKSLAEQANLQYTFKILNTGALQLTDSSGYFCADPSQMNIDPTSAARVSDIFSYSKLSAPNPSPSSSTSPSPDGSSSDPLPPTGDEPGPNPSVSPAAPADSGTVTS